MARVPGVSRSGYYAWKARPLSSRARTDELLKKEISSVHAYHHGTYGAPRIHGELQRGLESGPQTGGPADAGTGDPRPRTPVAAQPPDAGENRL